MSITIHPPEGPWTVEDLAALPDDGFRFEIREGNLVMISPVTIWHSRVMFRLKQVLVAAGRPAEMEVGVRRGSSNPRVADIAVFHEAPTDLHRSYWRPEDLALVIKIVSESSAEDDRTTKPRWYAQAGIPAYWRVEEGDDGDAVVFQYALARTASGEAGYVEDGVTTLAKLEAAAAG